MSQIKYNLPNSKGFFGNYGGMFVTSDIKKYLNIYYDKYKNFKKDGFINYYLSNLKKVTNRPSLIYEAKRINEEIKPGKLFFKREDLNHTGSHKINNVIGQVLFAKEMGYKNIVAETGAGQHGVAVASVCKRFNVRCVIFMGEMDVLKQKKNYKKMILLGAKVNKVNEGMGGLKESVNEAIKFWRENIRRYYYLLGSSVGPHPYPLIVRDFQRVIGTECINFVKRKKIDYLAACIGGGSNSIGLFYEFILRNKSTKLIAAEACGESRKNSVFNSQNTGILHGCRTYVLPQHDIYCKKTISSGLNYPAIGPEHAFLFDKGIVRYFPIKNNEAIRAFKFVTSKEGIIPSFESSHALFLAISYALNKKKKILVNLSGQGDKDIND
ncbi:tryptophan synthase subunit beta [Candidatus Vidania fulgoroideorum]